jgi:hypothetical protein
MENIRQVLSASSRKHCNLSWRTDPTSLHHVKIVTTRSLAEKSHNLYSGYAVKHHLMLKKPFLNIKIFGKVKGKDQRYCT